ncbi:4Fe-4S dicluster domain-containing protein [Aminipila butyrica]|uniref:4Fe-4S dicluster domain-containing protein n=1 Tax=Aminipila butyrica TaxID=433296 RepID=A0A858BSB2_9FIRM|nr:4Fe-4S binding protein [Aminipila butyrica]QIB68467.1 4Fe-4S dicluster domain-containing protein [Aminipila butyrica]
MDNIREMNRISGSANQSVQKWISAILALLPGSNCGGHGGCGLKSCQECAESIAQGAAVALCPACSQEAVDAIAGIVGTESMPVVERIAYIRCSGDAAGKKRLSGEDSCQQAREKGFLNSECSYGCIGLGSCVERCTFDAMSVEDGQVKIDREKCNGCGACIDLCPQQVILLVPREATNFIPCASENDEETTRKLCGSGCIGCGDCQEVCPQDAISMVNNCAVIDYDKCVGCVACTVKCRKKIIVDELHDLRKLKETVAFVRCRGGKKAQAKFKALGVETCTNAEKIRSRAMGLCQVGCIGLGECVEVCRYDAIAVVDGTAQVDPEKCVGCLDCVAVCPSKLIVEVPYGGSKQVACASTWDWEEKLQVCGSGCIGCGDCAANCPNGAITMENKRAVVDSQLCENCKICSYLCSRTALVELEVPEETYLQRRAMGI